MSQPFEVSRWLFGPFRILAFGVLLMFSFIPISFVPGLSYGYVNLSQLLLFALSSIALCWYLARIGADIGASLFLIFLIVISQIIGTTHSPASHRSFGTPFLFFTSMLIAPCVILMARSVPPATLGRIVSRIITGVLAFLAFECVTRLILSPHMPVTSDADLSDRFYLYKFSLFYVDSNFVGVEILCLLSIMFAFRGAVSRKKWFLAYILLFATLSRASIAAGMCQLIIYKLWRWRVWTALGLFTAQALVILKLLASFTTQGSASIKAIDGSFATKFYLLSLMAQVFDQADTAQRLFGVGAGNFVNLSQIATHNIITTFVLELGIWGSLLFIVYAWTHCRKCPEATYLLVLPMVIAGFSMVSLAAMPYFFGALGLLGTLRSSLRDGSGALISEVASRKLQKGRIWPESACS